MGDMGLRAIKSKGIFNVHMRQNPGDIFIFDDVCNDVFEHGIPKIPQEELTEVDDEQSSSVALTTEGGIVDDACGDEGRSIYPDDGVTQVSAESGSSRTASKESGATLNPNQGDVDSTVRSRDDIEEGDHRKSCGD